MQFLATRLAKVESFRGFALPAASARASRLLKKSDFVRSSTLDARTVLNPNGNKQESKRLFDAPKNVFQQLARGDEAASPDSLPASE
jgi:hypothetical protein